MQSREAGIFKTSDGTDIWYQTLGQGPLTLVLCDGVACTGYIWKYFIPHFASQYQIIHSQYRGHGESAIPDDLESMTVERFSLDILELLKKLKPKHPIVLVGHSMGVQVALECYRQNPERFQGLILINGPYGEALKHVHNNPLYAKALPALKNVFQKWDQYIQKIWRPMMDSELAYLYAVIFEVNPWLTHRKDFRLYFEDLGTMKPRVYLAALDGATRHTAEDMLPDIAVPVLVIAGDKDRFTPYPVCLKLHENIPNAELLTIPTGSHIGPLEMPEFIHLRVEKYLNAHFAKAGEKALSTATKKKKKKSKA